MTRGNQGLEAPLVVGISPPPAWSVGEVGRRQSQEVLGSLLAGEAPGESQIDAAFFTPVNKQKKGNYGPKETQLSI